MRLHALQNRHGAAAARAAIAQGTTTAPERQTAMAGEGSAAQRRAALADARTGLPDVPPAAVTPSVAAISPRLVEAVAEAIAASADRSAIGKLLHDSSAAIREATLDRLMAVAAAEPACQLLLGRRRALPPRAATALGAIMAADQLDLLPARPDLLENQAVALRGRIAERLEAAALEAARSGDRAALASLLAATSGMPPERIEAAIAMRSPRVIAALCWRAGWPATAAEAVQAAFGVEPSRVVSGNAEGGWTLSPTELQWQIQMLDDLPA